MLWLRVFKHVLPNARAWRITIDKTLRQFFEGLSETFADARLFFDQVYEDLDPQRTRALSEWEQQFALPNSNLTEQERRDRLDATWKDRGGQDPRYIQDTLQAAGFNVFVHEWWEPIPGRPAGGSVDNDVVPVARNPFTVLSDGTIIYTVECNEAVAECGEPEALCGNTNTPTGFLLVNKTIENVNYLIPPPPGTNTWPYIFYIGGEVFGESANVSPGRRDEFEALCLRICPTQLWLGMIITYA